MNADKDSRTTMDGFWLPQALRKTLLADAAWETICLDRGMIQTSGEGDGVSVRWPVLNGEGWRTLLTSLQRARVVQGHEVLARWKAALQEVQKRLAGEADRITGILADATGYSQEMIVAAFWQSDFVDLDLMAAAVDYMPSWSMAKKWEKIPNLPGRTRFFPASVSGQLSSLLSPGAPIFQPASRVDAVLGFAAGNVPGTALMVATLGSLANNQHGAAENAPAVLIRNSRHEPLFTPWVLSVVEEVDPELVSALAVLVWDYQDSELQAELMRWSGVMLAAAGDDTIFALEETRKTAAPALRFHKHGHKVSFAAIKEPDEADALLAAVDSVLWDQNGCLSARIHFIEGDADRYAQALTDEMRAFSLHLPRGSTPRRFIHRAFDTFTALQAGGRVKVLSGYGDDFAVILDERAWEPYLLHQCVNACMGRVVIVRPVERLLDAARMLSWLPPANLQSVSVKIEARLLASFATQCGKNGVTAIRSLGRAAFPQLAGSWDGLLPLDIGHVRPEGHFTTIEFDDLHSEMQATLKKWKMMR